jgi:hypothetical protein
MVANEAPSTRRPIPVFGTFLMWMAIVVVVKCHVLFDPPIWDAAFGLFPAAAELADNGFNIPRLLQQPVYREGGPNCHAESVITWMTAGVLWAFGKGPAAFLVLHLLHFAATAWTLAVLFKFTFDCHGPREAWLVCAALLACPLFGVQAGSMYFEMPLAACAVSSLVAYANGNLRRAVMWSLLAVLVKQAGVTVAGVLVAASLLRKDSWPKRLALAGAISTPVTVLAIAPLLGTSLLHSVSKPPMFQDWWAFMSHQHLPYLKAIPDITLAYVLSLTCGLLCAERVWKSLRTASPMKPLRLDDPAERTGSALDSPADLQPADSDVRAARSSLLYSVGVIQMFAFAGFFFVVPFVGRLEVYCVPRYFVFLLPLMFFGLMHVTAGMSRRMASAGLMVSTVWFIMNRDGAWYPPMQPNNGAIAERSGSCRWLAYNQRAVVHAAARLPADTLLLYGLPEHYFFSHPWMGYADRRHPGGRCVTLPGERPESLKSSDLPRRFHVLLDAGFLGGRELREILRDASDDPLRRIRLVAESGRPPFSVRLYEVTRIPDSQALSKR